jgi:hypothetical protein
MRMPFSVIALQPCRHRKPRENPKAHPLETKDGAPFVSLYFREYWSSGILCASVMSRNSILGWGHPPPL